MIKMKFPLVLVALIGCSLVSIEARGLHQDLQDIFALIPHTEMRAIARRHLNTDPEFQKVVLYLQGPEWAKLVAMIRENPKYQEFKAYLVKAGIDVDNYIAYIHSIISGAKPETYATRSIRSFLDEIYEVIPVDTLVKLIDHKMETSLDFQDLYKTISSEKSKMLIEQVRGLDEVEHIIKRLKEMKVDLDKVLHFFYVLFGWV